MFSELFESNYIDKFEIKSDRRLISIVFWMIWKSVLRDQVILIKIKRIIFHWLFYFLMMGRMIVVGKIYYVINISVVELMKSFQKMTQFLKFIQIHTTIVILNDLICILFVRLVNLKIYSYIFRIKCSDSESESSTSAMIFSKSKKDCPYNES